MEKSLEYDLLPSLFQYIAGGRVPPCSCCTSWVSSTHLERGWPVRLVYVSTSLTEKCLLRTFFRPRSPSFSTSCHCGLFSEKECILNLHPHVASFSCQHGHRLVCIMALQVRFPLLLWQTWSLPAADRPPSWSGNVLHRSSFPPWWTVT